LFSANGDLVQRYRELAEVVIVERALCVGCLLERESLRHFDVEGAGLDQAINLFERRILGPNILKATGGDPVVPPSLPNKARWNVRVGTSHWCSSVPPTPSGLLMS
jgi:hypothetical protein